MTSRSLDCPEVVLDWTGKWKAREMGNYMTWVSVHLLVIKGIDYISSFKLDWIEEVMYFQAFAYDLFLHIKS